MIIYSKCCPWIDILNRTTNNESIIITPPMSPRMNTLERQFSTDNEDECEGLQG